MIVKIQHAEPNGKVLIYSEDRRIFMEEINHDVARRLGDDLKGYFEAHELIFAGTRYIAIGDRVPDQEW